MNSLRPIAASDPSVSRAEKSRGSIVSDTTGGSLPLSSTSSVESRQTAGGLVRRRRLGDGCSQKHDKKELSERGSFDSRDNYTSSKRA